MAPLSDRLRALPKLEPPLSLETATLALALHGQRARSLPIPVPLGLLETSACIVVTGAYTVFVAANTIALLFG